MVDWHARTLIRTARDVLARDDATREGWRSIPGWDKGGRRHAEAAEGLLRLRHTRRRQACTPLLEELLDRTAHLDGAAALRLLAARLGGNGDVLTDACVERVALTAMRSWDRDWRAFPGDAWKALADAMDATGLEPSLWDRLTRILGQADAQEYRPFRESFAVSVTHMKGEPRMPLLLALRLLEEAEWWCQLGDVAFSARDWELAERYWRHANELGCAEIAPRMAVLALVRVVELVTDRLWGLDGPEGTYDAEAGADHTREWQERDEVLGLIREARELDQDWFDENRFCLLACAMALGMEEDFGVDPDELPELDVDDDEIFHFWLGFRALRRGDMEQARDAFAAADERATGWSDNRQVIRAFLAAAQGGPPVELRYELRSEDQNDGFVSLLPEPVEPRSPLQELLDEEPW